MKRALINVDYTYDFVAEDGKLTCGVPGQAIEEKIVAMTKEFIEAGDFVTFGIDAHKKGMSLHPETKLFPPHNIVGTSEWNLYGGLKELYEKHKDKTKMYFILKKHVTVLLLEQI